MVDVQDGKMEPGLVNDCARQIVYIVDGPEPMYFHLAISWPDRKIYIQFFDLKCDVLV